MSGNVIPITPEPAYAVLSGSHHPLTGVLLIHAIVQGPKASQEVRTYHEGRIDGRFASDDTPRFMDSTEAVVWMVEHLGEPALVEVSAAERLSPGTYAQPV